MRFFLPNPCRAASQIPDPLLAVFLEDQWFLAFHFGVLGLLIVAALPPERSGLRLYAAMSGEDVARTAFHKAPA